MCICMVLEKPMCIYMLEKPMCICMVSRSPCAYAWCHMALRGTPDLRCPPSARLYPSLLDLLRTCGTVWRTGMTARLWLSERLPRAPVRRGPAGEPARSNSHLSALTMRTVACGCAHHHHHVACAVPGSTLTGTLHASRITPPIMSRLPGLPHARASKVRQTVYACGARHQQRTGSLGQAGQDGIRVLALAPDRFVSGSRSAVRRGVGELQCHICGLASLHEYPLPRASAKPLTRQC